MNDSRACNEIRSLMPDWLDGELSAALRVRVDEHLAACAACREAFEQMQALGGDLLLLGRVADRIAERAPRRAQQPPMWRRPWVRAAAVVILISGGIYLASQRRGGQETVVDRTPARLSDKSGFGDRYAIALAPESECRVEGRTAVAMASANPRVRIVWLYEDAAVGEGSTESSGGARPRPRG